MKLYHKILAGFIFILSLVLICVFKNLPTGKLWDCYSVLYVNAETPDNQVTSLLDNNSIKDYVSLNNQYLPFVLGAFSPEVAFLQSNYDNSIFSYTNKRNAYFFDKSNRYRLYYIPIAYKPNLNSVVQQLTKANISCGVDTSANYPVFLPLLIFASYIILLVYAKNKYLFAVSGFLPVLFIFFNPFYTISISIILLLLCLFFLVNIWKRKNFLLCLFTNYFVIIMIFMGLVSTFATNWKTGLLYILCIMGTISSIIIYNEVENYFVNQKSFIPVYIINANRTSIFAKKGKIILPACTVMATLCIILFLLTSLGNVSSKSSTIVIPAESSLAAEELPDFEDYYKFMWAVKSAPYQNLNSNKLLDEVSFPRYINKNGILEESAQKMYFSQDFKDKVLSDIDNLKFNSIEKVLKSQNEHFTGGYKSTSSYNTSIFGIIILVISYFLLLFFYISFIIKRGIRK